MNAVLVTGGAGYIGSHVAKALSLAGFKPVTVDNLERGYEIAVKWGPLEKVNLLNSNDLDDVFIRHSPYSSGASCSVRIRRVGHEQAL